MAGDRLSDELINNPIVLVKERESDSLLAAVIFSSIKSEGRTFLCQDLGVFIARAKKLSLHAGQQSCRVSGATDRPPRDLCPHAPPR